MQLKLFCNIGILKIKDFLIYLSSIYKVNYKIQNDPEVDIVFLWVDGDDPAHKKKKNLYLKNEINIQPIEDKAIKEYRWSNNDEIIIALRSVEVFCPWVRKIWIITDKQTPRLDTLNNEFIKKINIVDHEDIFSGYGNLLPVFNSLAIETFLWRIKDLTENFIYLNDDMFLLKPVSKKDFFIAGKPIIRGGYKTYNKKELTLHHNVVRNGALITGFESNYFFKQGHAPYVMNKSQMEELFNLYKDSFEKNSQYKFRSREQFNTVSLFYHKSIADSHYIINFYKDYMHLSEAACKNLTRDELTNKLDKIKNKKIKFICINDLGALKTKVPDFFKYLPEELS